MGEKLKKAIGALAKSLQASASRPYDIQKIYYAYILLDPRKRGKYKYRVEDRIFEFDHEPFYVGKGHGDRMYLHEKKARRNESTSNPHKDRILKKILKAGLRPLAVQVSLLSTEARALAKETLLIQGIGRHLDGGPLTNLTAGGEGHSGFKASKDTRRKMREAHANRTQSQKEESERKRQQSVDRAAVGRAVSAAHAQHSPDRKAEIQNLRRASLNSYSEEKKQQRAAKAAESMRLRNLTNPLPIVSCPHCGIKGTTRGLKRWHFENCRHK